MRPTTYTEAVAAGFTQAYIMTNHVGVWNVLLKDGADLDEEVEAFIVEVQRCSTVSAWLQKWEFDGVVCLTDTI